MEKKKKIWAAIAAIVIIIILALVFVFAGKDNTTVADTDVVETISSETVTVESTEASSESTVVESIDYLAGITEAPEDNSGEEKIEKENIKDFVDTSKKEETKVETVVSESSKSEVSIIEPGVLEKPDNTKPTKPVSTKPDVDVSLENTTTQTKVETPVQTTTPVETTTTTPPVVDPEPVTPPSSNSGGSAEYSGNTITTDTGFVVPLLKEFNQIGANLDNDKYSWAGEWGDPTADKFIDDMGNTLDAFGIHNFGASADFLLANQNELHWYPWDADANPHLYLKKGGDHWKLVITSPILDLKTAQANENWPGINEYSVKYAKDALVVLLSTITPDCVEVKDAILKNLFVDSKAISDNENWTTIGSTLIRLYPNGCNTQNGNFIFTYHIKGK